MNKEELIDTISRSADVPKARAAKLVAAFSDAVASALKSGDTVTLTGFGTFSAAQRASRKGRNPRTGKEMKSKASKAPRFKAGKALKDAVK